MMTARRSWTNAGLFLLVLGSGMPWTVARAQPPAGPQEPAPPAPQAPPPLDGPRNGIEALPPALDATAGQEAARASRGADLEEDTAPTAPGARVYLSKEPPPPIAERPSGDRLDPKAVWTSGYWEWDADGGRFVWVAGRWRVPPARMVWVAGRWMHDARGWYWVPGAWGRRVNRPTIASQRPAWRTSGPPAEHPDDTPPPAPGPNAFYISGHYAPAGGGDRLAWIPGFWADVQPGWDWIPARWIRRSDGWDFRDGHWIRDSASAVVERVPARARRRARRNADVTVIARDPITGVEVAVETAGAPVPVSGAPYYVIRPPGAYPYGPNGVVVPGTVPPFVRRMLDRVLP